MKLDDRHLMEEIRRMESEVAKLRHHRYAFDDAALLHSLDDIAARAYRLAIRIRQAWRATGAEPQRGDTLPPPAPPPVGGLD